MATEGGAWQASRAEVAVDEDAIETTVEEAHEIIKHAEEILVIEEEKKR